MEGGDGGCALSCLRHERARLCDVVDVYIWDKFTKQAKKQAVSGWIGMVPRKMVHSTTLRLLGTISCTDTLLSITTINDTHLLAWKLFGPQRIGQIVCFPSCFR